MNQVSCKTLIRMLLLPVVALTACTPTQSLLGIKPNVKVQSSQAVLTTDQAQKIALRALGQAQVADSQRSTAAATQAFTGVALRTSAPLYASLPPLPQTDTSVEALAEVDPPRVVLPLAGAGFPRALITVWTPPVGQTEQLALVSSAKALDPFRVSLRTNLVPGAMLPPLNTGAQASPLVSLSGSNSPPPSAEALADLGTLLTTGSAARTQFAPSKVVTDIRASAAAQKAKITAVGSFSQTHVVDAQGAVAFGTSDGGTLVLATLTRTDTFTVRPGVGSITPSPQSRALNKNVTKITKSATQTTIEVVALAIPAKKAANTQLIGFSEIPVSFTGS